MPKLPGIQVVRSSIHGYGVVATRDFAELEEIAEVDGVAWREDEPVDDRYSLWIVDGIYMDMVDQTRWINHSCAPNCEIEADIDENGNAWARIVALRPIQRGEELTYDYAFPLELAEPCHCGTPNCRTMIIDPDELPRYQKLMARRRSAAARRQQRGTGTRG
ncbi:MAG: SET domain-containing protein-lysine N-methyltransferase [Deltaproteobacteria bacterium]|nr:SET domain-containing protein-lysine N-methyltransferase [Deltaproteobacteria bacterium]